VVRARTGGDDVNDHTRAVIENEVVQTENRIKNLELEHIRVADWLNGIRRSLDQERAQLEQLRADLTEAVAE